MKGQIVIDVETVPSDIPDKKWRLDLSTTCTFRPRNLDMACAVLRVCCDALELDDNSRIIAFSAITAGLFNPSHSEKITVSVPQREGSS